MNKNYAVVSEFIHHPDTLYGWRYEPFIHTNDLSGYPVFSFFRVEKKTHYYQVEKKIAGATDLEKESGRWWKGS